MTKGNYRNASLYNKVEVLFLFWEVADLDMNTLGEVEELKLVFEKDFGYHATIERLAVNPVKRLQTRVNRKIAVLVDDHGARDTLLIIFYAGHDLLGEFFNDLVLPGLFEDLAAAKDQGLTGVPGPTSFTRALTFALRALVREKSEGRFTTDELLRKIKPDFPGLPTNQKLVMSVREDKNNSAGGIMLHPLQHNSVDG
ncbi:MAG: hypothetical protein Q9182_002849 [Xanthomendoza sp. 2 TL-2023]